MSRRHTTGQIFGFSFAATRLARWRIHVHRYIIITCQGWAIMGYCREHSTKKREGVFVRPFWSFYSLCEGTGAPRWWHRARVFGKPVPDDEFRLCLGP
jgi:hypothetical protein